MPLAEVQLVQGQRVDHLHLGPRGERHGGGEQVPRGVQVRGQLLVGLQLRLVLQVALHLVTSLEHKESGVRYQSVQLEEGIGVLVNPRGAARHLFDMESLRRSQKKGI